MSQGQFVTIYEMKSVIERCFKECKEAGFIEVHKLDVARSVTSGVKTENYDCIINPEAVADHISKTLIGELHEFEIIRRLSPMFREFDRLRNDMKLLDEKQAQESGFAGLRIGQK